MSETVIAAFRPLPLKHIEIQVAKRERHNAVRRAKDEPIVGMRKRITRVRELETGESAWLEGNCDTFSSCLIRP